MTNDPTWRRRDFLRVAGGALLLSGPLARGDEAVDAIRAKGKAAGLPPFRTAETATFAGVGDAPAAFLDESLAVCEALAADYRKQFSRRGFTLADPPGKLRIVVLSSSRAYAAFDKVDDPGSEVGGHYDVTGNYQVTFDSRNEATGPPGLAERVNAFTLVHETVHQLTYNTGVLRRDADVPTAVSEALATFAETWRPRKKGEIGQTNRLRLDPLRGARWIPLAHLLGDDKLFEDPDLKDVAYGESYLLASYFLKEKARTPRLLAYLDALRPGSDPRQRAETAAKHLGDLDQLDRQLPRAR